MAETGLDASRRPQFDTLTDRHPTKNSTSEAERGLDASRKYRSFTDKAHSPGLLIAQSTRARSRLSSCPPLPLPTRKLSSNTAFTLAAPIEDVERRFVKIKRSTGQATGVTESTLKPNGS